jgi:hypothetical protein
MSSRVRHVFASSPTMAITHPTAALAACHTHFVPVPSELWSGSAFVLVTATIAPTLAATFAYAASTRWGAIPKTSMVTSDGTPVRHAALH